MPRFEVLPGRDFLADDERVLGSEQTVAERALALVADPRPDLETVFRAANLLALVLFRLGRTDDARQLCRDEISVATHLPASGQHAYGAALALQPQINLIRIDSYLGNLADASAGLAALESVVDGNAVQFSDLTWEPAIFAADPGLFHDSRILARNVLVTDTCKALFRARELEQLLSAAERFELRWPNTILGGLHHPAEAAFLIDPEAQPIPAPSSLHEGPLPLRRLAFIRTLHLADHFAHLADVERATALVRTLQTSWADVDGVFSSSATVPRWQTSLGRTLLALGRPDQAVELLDEALATSRSHDDPATARMTAKVLQLADPDAVSGFSEPDKHRAHEVAAAAAARLRELLAEPAGSIAAVGAD